MSLPEIFTSVLRASCLGGAAVLLLLMVRWMAGRSLAPAWRCWLWLPVAVLFFMPRLPDMGWHWQSAELPVVVREVIKLDTAPSVDSAVATPAPAARSPAVQPASASKHLPSALDWAARVWVGGASGLLALWLSAYAMLLRRVHRGRKPATDSLRMLLDSCSREAGLRKTPRLLVTDAVDNPAVAGVFFPTVLVPERLPSMLDERELRFVLQHEIWHVKRRDLWFHWCFALLLAVHWFNPLLWMAARLFRADREAACDAAVLSTSCEDLRGLYGDTLLKLQARLARAFFLRPIVGVLGGVDLLKTRILDIANFGRSSRSAGAVATLLVVIGVAALAAFAGEPAKDKGAPGAEPAAVAPKVPGTEQSTASIRVEREQWVMRRIDELAGVVPQQVYLNSKFISFDASKDIQSPLNWFASTGDKDSAPKDSAPQRRAALAYLGTFSDPQFQVIMRAISQSSAGTAPKVDANEAGKESPPSLLTTAFKTALSHGRKLQSAPSVTTRNGQRATVEVVREFIYPTAFERKESEEPAGNPRIVPSSFSMRPLGISMEVDPVVRPDLSIELKVAPAITAFLKWQEFKATDGQFLRNPIFGSSSCASTVVLQDGQTVAFGGYAYQASFAGTDLAKLTEHPLGDALCPVLVFVTAKLIDPTGKLTPPKSEGNRGIVIPRIKLSDVTLADAVSQICDLARKNDRGGKGVSIMLRHPDTEPPRITLDASDVTISGVLRLLASITHLEMLLVPQK